MNQYVVPLSTLLTALPLLIVGVIAWSDLDNAAADNATKISKQDAIIERLVKDSRDAEVQRAIMSEQQRQMLEILRELKKDMDNNERSNTPRP